MRLMGFCIECHRFRWVRIVREWGFLQATGVCQECEDKEGTR